MNEMAFQYKSLPAEGPQCGAKLHSNFRHFDDEPFSKPKRARGAHFWKSINQRHSVAMARASDRETRITGVMETPLRHQKFSGIQF